MPEYIIYLDTGFHVEADTEEQALELAYQQLKEWTQADLYDRSSIELTVDETIEADDD